MAGTRSHLCFCVERMKISKFRTTTEERERERNRFTAAGRNGPVSSLGATGGTALPPATKPNEEPS